MRKRACQASPVSGPSSQGSAVARGADPQAMVRRSRIASCVTCGLCGGLLRDAAVVPDCLHSFCRQCIVEEFTNNNINCCPKCDIDWGCNPLKKLRSDRSLQHIRSVIFPDKRHKVGEISPLHPAFVTLPSPSNQAHGIDHSAKKADAHLMPEPMNFGTETETDERLGTEPSPSLEIIASSTNTAVAPGAQPEWPEDSRNGRTDEQREEASSPLSESESNGEELREAIEGSRVELCAPIPKRVVQFEETKTEHHSLLDKQATLQERGKLTEEVNPWTIAVEKMATDCTVPAQGWSEEGWMTVMAACAAPNMSPDPWTIAVEKMATDSNVSAHGWSEEGWATAMAAYAAPDISLDPWTIAVEKMANESTVSAQGWSEDGWATTMSACAAPNISRDPWTIAVEKMATKSTVSADGWSEEGWTTAMAACAAPDISPDPWTIAVEKMANESTVSAQGWSEEGWATTMSACTAPNISPDPWTLVVEKMATKSTVSADGWSEEGWTTAMAARMAACAAADISPDPWTIAVEKLSTDATVSAQGWSEEGWTRMAAGAPANISWHHGRGSLRTTLAGQMLSHHMQRDRGHAMLPREVARKEAAKRAAAAKDADQAKKEAGEARASARAERDRASALTEALQAERSRAQVLEDLVGRLRRELEAARASEADARRQLARRAELGRLRDRMIEQHMEKMRAAVAETSEYVLACCLSHDASLRPEAVLEGVVAADEVEEAMLRGRARGTAWKVANDAPPRPGTPDGGGGHGGAAGHERNS